MATPRIRSIGFPFRKANNSFPGQDVDLEAIKASVIQIVTTAKGERIMRPNFGSNAFNYVFESINEDLKITVEREVRQALATFDSRIRVDSVDVTADEVVEPGQLTIFVQYTVLLSGEPDSVAIGGGI